jgi:hypothetical protein
MFNGNLYGLIITMLTFVITVVLTMRQVEQSGVHVEFIIRPVTVAKLNEIPEHQTDNPGSVGQILKDRIDGVPPQRAGKQPLTQ